MRPFQVKRTDISEKENRQPKKIFAHRGIIEYENTIKGVLEVMDTFVTLGVEVDVRYNTERDVVMCHDRENRNMPNSTFMELLSVLEKGQYFDRDLMIDVKAFGIYEAQNLAKKVCMSLAKHPNLLKVMNIYLCSFNEYCVSEMCFCRDDLGLSNVSIGVITSGIPLGMFKHLNDIQFVSIEYSTLCEEIMENFKNTNTKVYAWVVNDMSMNRLMCEYGVDGIIRDVSAVLTADNSY